MPCHELSDFPMKNCKFFLCCNVTLTLLHCPLIYAVTDGFKFQWPTSTAQARVGRHAPSSKNRLPKEIPFLSAQWSAGETLRGDMQLAESFLRARGGGGKV